MGPLSAADRQRRASLLQVKLGALARSHFGAGDPAFATTPLPFAAGAALTDPATATGFVLVDEPVVERDPMDPEGSDAPLVPRGWLGGAVLLAVRHRLATVHVLLDHPDPADARRASLFAPEVRVWRIEGRSLEAVAAEPFVAPPVPRVDALAFSAVIEAAGADAVVEHGALRAEVLGLEVGRVVVDEDGEPVLEVGVGRHDRLAHAMLHADVPVSDALQRAVDAVRRHRRADVGAHPANQLSPERWLRAAMLARPDLVGAVALEPVAGTEPARFRIPSPAVAVGRRADGAVMVVACSTGVDLDAAASAADAWADHVVRTGDDAALVLVLPDGDDLPAVRELAAALRHPAELVTVPRTWRALTGPSSGV